jgi:hypothetical protein
MSRKDNGYSFEKYPTTRFHGKAEKPAITDEFPADTKDAPWS